MDNLEEMDRCLERYSLPRLNQKETENMNISITSTEIETVVENLTINKSPGPDCFIGEFYKAFREVNTYSSKTVPKELQRKENFQTHFVKPPSLWYQNQTKLLKKKKKRNDRPVSLININAKILNRILAICVQQYIKKIMHHD